MCLAYQSGSKTGTVWDNITPTQENYPYANIPKSFEIEVNGWHWEVQEYARYNRYGIGKIYSFEDYI